MTENIRRENAVIRSTFLGVEDHGILTFSLGLDGDGWGQSFGGYCCDGPMMAVAVRLVLETLKVDSWENLIGTNVRMVGTSEKITKIGHVVEDRWCDLGECAKKVQEGEEDHPKDCALARAKIRIAKLEEENRNLATVPRLPELGIV